MCSCSGYVFLVQCSAGAFPACFQIRHPCMQLLRRCANQLDAFLRHVFVWRSVTKHGLYSCQSEKQWCFPTVGGINEATLSIEQMLVWWGCVMLRAILANDDWAACWPGRAAGLDTGHDPPSCCCVCGGYRCAPRGYRCAPQLCVRVQRQEGGLSSTLGPHATNLWE